MSFADSSDIVLAAIAEASWGVTPTTPAFKRQRFTSDGLEYQIENKVSDEIRADADVSDLIQVGAMAAGDFGFELSYDGALQDLIAAALRGAWSTDVLKGGLLKPSLTFEKKFETGATDQYHRFAGSRIGQWQCSIKAKEIIAGSFNIMGKGASTGTAIISGATYADPGTAPVMAAPDVASITVGGIVGSVFFTDLSFSLNNNLRAQAAIGSKDLVGIGFGRREITGQMKAYFENGELYDLFVAGTPSSLEYTVSDGDNAYEFLFPRIKFLTGGVPAGGNNQDVFVNATWQALIDPTEACAIKITRVPAS